MNIVLAIDDDPMIQEYYCELLVPEGFQVILAANAQDGLSKLAKYQPDILLLDMALPGGDGRSLLKDIKKIDKQLPIVVISGKSGMQSDPEIQMSQQVCHFFTKPVPGEDLLTVIRRLVAAHQAQEQKRWIGKELGGYKIRGFVGGGGAGIVFKGQNDKQAVAIKILPQRMSEPDDLVRFQREAQALSQIHHPNIIQILNAGTTTNGVHFIVMDFFPGENLQTIYKKGTHFPLAEIGHIIRQVAAGMAEVHAAGIIHRDLKPSNILYDQQQKQAKVIDFGLARPVALDERNLVTQQGCTLGTPAYMSPEQCQGRPLDGRSDVYNLGVTFFQLLTNQLPFRALDTMAMLYAQTYEPLTWPAEQVESIPEPVRTIVEAMLNKIVEERCDMRQVVVMLTTLVGETTA